MSYQSEAELERFLMEALENKLAYKFTVLHNYEELVANFRVKLYEFNKANLKNLPFTDKEFERVMNFINGNTIFSCAIKLRDKFKLERDDGTSIYLAFIDFNDYLQNCYQITHQVTKRGKYENKYDVTLLINGFPVVQVELKRRGLGFKEAFNQICRYSKHSYDGLFHFIQLFVISNGVDTKYFANNDGEYKFKDTFYWTDDTNKRLNNMNDFANAFLSRQFLIDLLGKYTVLNETDKLVMVMRPYQVYSVKVATKTALDTASNGYLWLATGSGKTLTSFKLARILADSKTIEKVIYLVDRQDLDAQSVKEFNKFEKDSVDITDDTRHLIRQMKDRGTTFIATTVQKMNLALKNFADIEGLKSYQDEKVIFIIDECHRSQFGAMHNRIKNFFHKAQFIGFTGTPIFKENAGAGERTTTDIFGRCLYTYLTKDAIYDNNVLGFSVEYVRTFEGQYDPDDPTLVQGINTQEIFNNEERLSLIVNYILANHSKKTNNRKYSALFATPSIKTLIKYYALFKKNNLGNLVVGAIFTYYDNEDPEEDRQHSRDSLELIIKDYNLQFGTNFDTSTLEAYNRDVSKNIKAGKIDILLVVNMYLTGFDSATTSTLYVDKNLQWHTLMQAYSRTNRLYDASKIWGNIVCFRNLKENTDAAIALFSNTENVNEVLMGSYQTYLKAFREKIVRLKAIAAQPSDVDQIKGEEKQAEFVNLFKAIAQDLLALKTFNNFEFEEATTGITEQTYEDYKSKYQDLYDEHKLHKQAGEQVSILDDIDFAIELIQTDRINYDYIMKLIGAINRKDKTVEAKDVQFIIRELNRATDPGLRKKTELVKEFLTKELPVLEKNVATNEAYEKYEDKARSEDIKNFAKEINLSSEFVEKQISEYEYTNNINRKRLMDTIELPFNQRRITVEKLINFILENVLKFQ